jgi:hypothetical protein
VPEPRTHSLLPLLAVYQLPQRQADVMRLQCVCGGTPSRGEQAASLTSAHLIISSSPSTLPRVVSSLFVPGPPAVSGFRIRIWLLPLRSLL